MDIKGIIFDFGFTLFYFDDPSVERYYSCFNDGLQKCVELLKKSNVLKNKTAEEQFLNLFNRERRSAFKQSFKTKMEYPTEEIPVNIQDLTIPYCKSKISIRIIRPVSYTHLTLPTILLV